jgi:hypothetical protein
MDTMADMVARVATMVDTQVMLLLMVMHPNPMPQDTSEDLDTFLLPLAMDTDKVTAVVATVVVIMVLAMHVLQDVEPQPDQPVPQAATTHHQPLVPQDVDHHQLPLVLQVAPHHLALQDVEDLLQPQHVFQDAPQDHLAALDHAKPNATQRNAHQNAVLRMRSHLRDLVMTSRLPHSLPFPTSLLAIQPSI